MRRFRSSILPLFAISLTVVSLLGCKAKNPSADAIAKSPVAKTLRGIWLLPPTNPSAAELEKTLSTIEARGFNTVVFQLKSDAGELAFPTKQSSPYGVALITIPQFSTALKTTKLNVIYNYPVKWARPNIAPLPNLETPETTDSERAYAAHVPNSFDPKFWPTEFETLLSLRDTLVPLNEQVAKILFSHVGFSSRTAGLSEPIFAQFKQELKLPTDSTISSVLRYDSLAKTWVEGPNYAAWLQWRRALVYKESQELASFWPTQMIAANPLATMQPPLVYIQGEGIPPLADESGFSIAPPTNATNSFTRPRGYFLECLTPYVYREEAVVAKLDPAVSLEAALELSQTQAPKITERYVVLSALVFAGSDGLLSEQEKQQLLSAIELSERLANGWVLLDWSFIESTNLQLPTPTLTK